MADERLSIRRSVVLHQQYLLLSRRMSSYPMHDPRLVALVCAFASPTVCTNARPGDSKEHARPLRMCKDCANAVCFACSSEKQCDYCGRCRVRCAPCAKKPLMCAGRCGTPIRSRCVTCAFYTHVPADSEAHSALCGLCQGLWKCAMCKIYLCATCPDRSVIRGFELLCLSCATILPKKRKIDE